MNESIKIAVDAMGGDQGPNMVVPGLDLAFERHPELKVLLVGDQSRIKPLLDGYPRVRDRTEILHTDVSVSMDDKPSQALRRGRRTSSMWLAIEAVKEARVNAVLSAGNTGALMAMAKIILDTIEGVERPAIAAVWPTLRGESIVLDVGATIGGVAEQLFDFAIMGEAMARCLFGIERPTVGLLNVGVEEVKGIEEVKKAARMLRESQLPIEYLGFVEGDDIGKGTVDVVVTEGFSGNIALKAAEGTARQMQTYIRTAVSGSLLAKIGLFLASGALKAVRDKIDPRNSNGGVFLGVNGIVVKSHGGTDAVGFACAVDVTVEMVRHKLIGKIVGDLSAKQALGEIASESDSNAQ